MQNLISGKSLSRKNKTLRFWWAKHLPVRSANWARCLFLSPGMVQPMSLFVLFARDNIIYLLKWKWANGLRRGVTAFIIVCSIPSNCHLLLYLEPGASRWEKKQEMKQVLSKQLSPKCSRPGLSDQRFEDPWRETENLWQLVLRNEKLCPNKSEETIQWDSFWYWIMLPLK